ncbi:tachylectin-2-like [Pseudophryne corroboree]|uniref:tachylectin-2-like n=1 Tax=Pseudophryne corroboree TaxID=495146 RepID=UPI003081AF31
MTGILHRLSVCILCCALITVTLSQRCTETTDECMVIVEGTEDFSLYMVPRPCNSEYIFNENMVTAGALRNLNHFYIDYNDEIHYSSNGFMHKGPWPPRNHDDSFSDARSNLETTYENAKIYFLSREAVTYLITNDGKLYIDLESGTIGENWRNEKATMIGTKNWDLCDTVAFYPDGTMYAVVNDSLLKVDIPSQPMDFLDVSTTVEKSGWGNTQFMSFTDKGEMLVVNRVRPGLSSYICASDYSGWNYHLSKPPDKTIDSQKP